MDRKNTWMLIGKKIAVAILIIVFIQVLNQILIISGSALESALGPGNLDARILVGIFQQIVQAITGIVLYKIFFHKGSDELGINQRNKKTSIKYIQLFAGVWIGVIILSSMIMAFGFPDYWMALKSVEPLQNSALLPTLFFEAVFPGIGEEILFRGFIINLLAGFVFVHYQENILEKIGVIVLSSLYFGIAHIYFSLVPFQITHFDFFQVMTAIGFGMVYAVIYLKTQSLLTPILLHNFANTTSTLWSYWISLLD